MPAEERWQFFLKDLEREEYGSDRVKVVKAWMSEGERFTLWERQEILDRVEDEDDREMVRELFVKFEQLDENPKTVVAKKKRAAS